MYALQLYIGKHKIYLLCKFQRPKNVKLSFSLIKASFTLNFLMLDIHFFCISFGNFITLDVHALYFSLITVNRVIRRLLTEENQKCVLPSFQSYFVLWLDFHCQCSNYIVRCHIMHPSLAIEIKFQIVQSNLCYLY